MSSHPQTIEFAVNLADMLTGYERVNHLIANASYGHVSDCGVGCAIQNAGLVQEEVEVYEDRVFVDGVLYKGTEELLQLVQLFDGLYEKDEEIFAAEMEKAGFPKTLVLEEMNKTEGEEDE